MSWPGRIPLRPFLFELGFVELLDYADFERLGAYLNRDLRDLGDLQDERQRTDVEDRGDSVVWEGGMTRIGAVVGLAAVTLALGWGQGEYYSADRVCVMKLKRLGLGILIYMRYNDHWLPPMDSQWRMERAVNPILQRELKEFRGQKLSGLWRCPHSGLPYVPNAVLRKSKRRIGLGEMAEPHKMVLLRDARPHSDKQWRTLFVDGHVRAYRTRRKEGLR